MIFGIPVEIRNHENRVGATPALVDALVKREHTFFVERGAGAKSMFDDIDFENAGATIVPSPEKLYGQSEYILKIRAPKPVEYELIEPHHTLFAFFQFFNYPEMVRALLGRGANCYGFELYRVGHFSRPILDADRAIAGQLAIQQGAYYLQRHHGGRGAFIGRSQGTASASVMVFGASAAGLAAAQMAADSGAKVTLVEVDESLLQIAKHNLPDRVRLCMFSNEMLRSEFPKTDLVVFAYQRVEMAKPPKLEEQSVGFLPRGAVIIDLDIEYDGGALVTSRPTKIDNPTFVQNEVIHFCVPNLAGTVPQASSIAHSEALKPLIFKVAENGLLSTLKNEPSFRSGLVIYEGQIANAQLAENLSTPFFDVAEASE